MIEVLQAWYRRYFSHEEAVLLVVVFTIAAIVIYLLGKLLAPVFAAIIVAYLMQGMVNMLARRNMPHIVSVTLVYTFFLSLLLLLLFMLLPLAWSQMVTLVNEQVPRIMLEIQELVLKLPERYPDYITQDQVRNGLDQGQTVLAELGQRLLSVSITSLPGIMAVLVFIILVPVLVFFFMKDKDLFIAKFVSILPENKGVLVRVWNEMDEQISNYVRGKALEIFIVGGACYTCFVWSGLKYSELLSVIVGLSVLIPYIGAVVVTIPVVLVAYFQFGLGSDFYQIMLLYAVIQLLDGNVLVPLLFSEAVNLHPVAIIVAVLIFGGLWGLWGVFFAIPLATLVKAIISAWPHTHQAHEGEVVAN